jgi:hypothetical protein
VQLNFSRFSIFGFANLGMILVGTILPGCLSAEQLVVRQAEGVVHGFLSLSSTTGTLLATGDLEQTTRGSRVTSRLIFHFKDGSVQDETTEFSQSGHFHLISDHLIQKGPTFQRQLDLVVNASTGMATARYREGDGKEKTETVHLNLPPDLANGMVPVLLKNLSAGTSLAASMVVAAPKPQLVKLAITPDGEDGFLVGDTRRTAVRYVVKVEIGGVKGALAPLVGKQPPDTKVWIVGGPAPVFVRSDGPACEGCPIWRTELLKPVWPNENSTSADRKK